MTDDSEEFLLREFYAPLTIELRHYLSQTLELRFRTSAEDRIVAHRLIVKCG
ncbi:MAG: hypothetical protein NVSMB39_4700 [Candidatus Saccharimonadales bacterium]